MTASNDKTIKLWTLHIGGGGGNDSRSNTTGTLDSPSPTDSEEQNISDIAAPGEDRRDSSLVSVSVSHVTIHWVVLSPDFTFAAAN